MWVEVRDRSGLRSRSVVDLRMVDLSVVDVRVDMDEVDSHRVVNNWDLSWLSYPTRPWIWAWRLRPLEKSSIDVFPRMQGES